MGMGKSLSVLALILRSLEAAHQWSVQPDTSLSENWRTKPRSSATLIVASSDRTCSSRANKSSTMSLTITYSHDQ
jgi:hypothetical protein